jgi:hypothetical protein
MRHQNIADRWACSIVTESLLNREIAVFLRTHRNGVEQLRELLRSVPADRTEDEYYAARARAERDAQELAALNHENALRRSNGLPPVTLADVPGRLRWPPPEAGTK